MCSTPGSAPDFGRSRPWVGRMRPRTCKRFYPSSVMETGYEILFFWVARMVFFGIEMMGEPPFHTVYLHGTVRDAEGAKMSKTKGNVLDPTEITDEYGADALRFALATQGSAGVDSRLSLRHGRVEPQLHQQALERDPVCHRRDPAGDDRDGRRRSGSADRQSLDRRSLDPESHGLRGHPRRPGCSTRTSTARPGGSCASSFGLSSATGTSRRPRFGCVASSRMSLRSRRPWPTQSTVSCGSCIHTRRS